MHGFRLAALAVVALSFTAPVPAQTPPPLPRVEAFGTLPAVSNPSLSPDGNHLAVIQLYNGRPAAVIYDLADPTNKPVALPYADGFVVRVQWKSENRLLITVHLNQRPEWLGNPDVYALFRIVSVDSKGQNAVILISQEDRDHWTSSANIVDLALDDDKHVYIQLGKHIYQADVATGKSGPVFLGLIGSDISRRVVGTADWVMDGHGWAVARVDRNSLAETDTIKIPEGNAQKGVWKDLVTVKTEVGAGISIAGLSQDGTAIISYGTSSDGIRGLRRTALKDGVATPLFFDSAFDVDEPLIDPWSGRVIGVSYAGDMMHYHYFEPFFAAMQQGFEAGFPDKSVHAVSWNLTKSKVVLEISTKNEPRAYYLLNRATQHISALGNAYPGLKNVALGTVQPYNYAARDGLRIPAYLTLPPNKSPKNLPVVVLPHGGPMARDTMEFDWQAQFLTNRGYAVLQPNFRGSSGYGRKFERAGYGEWGLKMQDDVTDGVKKLIADGIADPKRVCIVGGSYGGYAALAGATLTPDLYACAASWAGVTDLQLFLDTREREFGKHSSMIQRWEQFIGDAWSDSSKLKAASPARIVDRIKCPVLLMHGEDDTTVRIDQSEKMRDALERAHKKFTYVRVKGESHYMLSAATRIQWLTELEKFLEENIGH